MKSTATSAQLTVHGKVSETFARTKPSDDLDDFPLFTHHEIDSLMYLASRSYMKIKWIDESQGVSLKKFMSAQHRNQTKDVKENMLKGLNIVDIEMFAGKSCKSSVYFRWNDWQSIVIETEHGIKNQVRFLRSILPQNRRLRLRC